VEAEAAGGLLFGVAWICLMTLGCVLLLHFWAGGLSTFLRALLATFLVIALTSAPIFLFADTNEQDTIVGLVGIGLGILVIGFPIAFLATRKLVRDGSAKTDISGIFE
jgi:hypothetical protein